MRSLSAIGRVAAVGALIAAVVLVGLDPLRRRRRRRLHGQGALPERRPAREGQPRAGGRRAGRLREGHQDHGRRRRPRSRSRSTATTHRCAGARAPRSASSPSPGSPTATSTSTLPPNSGRQRSRTAASSTPTRPSPRSTSTSSTTRSTRRRARRSRASSRARRTSGATVARRGQRRLPVPEPGAVHLAPALQRADQGHPAARALPRRQLADGHRARGAPRRPRGPDRQPQRHHARARQPEGGARRVDRPAPAVHAPRQHDVREPALDPRRRRPARRGLEAGGEAPRPVPLAGPGLRRRRRADGPRPQPHDPQAGPRERPDQPHAVLPAAGRDRHGRTKDRTYAPGGTRIDVGETRGAFPETVDALKGGAGEIGFARPYTTDFLGWFDDFSTTGGGFDALGATRARLHHDVARSSHPDSLATKQYQRCPGSAEAPAKDGSNVCPQAEREPARLRRDATGGRRGEARA